MIPCLAPFDLLATGLNGGPFAGFRNLVHNGLFSVNQRGHASGAALAAGAHGHDRWKAGASGCTYTFTANAAGNAITITAGSLQQVVDMEGRFGGGYVLSWIGSAQCRVNGGSYQSSPINLSLTTGTNFTIEFSAGTLFAPVGEFGSIPTPAETRWPFELAICQRYFWQWSSAVAAYTFLGMHVPRSTTAGAIQIPLHVPMRAAPSLSVFGNFITLDDGVSVTLASAAHFPGVCVLNTIGTFAAGNSRPCYSNNSLFCAVGLSADL